MSVVLYLIQSAAITALFYLVYIIALKKTTFYRPNRYFLIGAFILSAVLPLLPVPSAHRSDTVTIFGYLNNNSTGGISAIPEAGKQPATEAVFFPEWENLAIILYGLIAMFLLIRQLIQIRRVTALAKYGTASYRDTYRYLQIKGLPAPFSFGRSVYYDPAAQDEATLQHILDHETAHVAQGHTYDLLLATFYCSIFWMNPFGYLTRRAMQLNLEFLADEAAVSQSDSATAYQYSLLRQVDIRKPVALIHHFSQSFIKNRIVMMNQKPSVKAQRLRYAMILPALALGIGLISATKAPSVQSIENPLSLAEVQRNDSTVIATRFPGGKQEYAMHIARYCRYPAKARNENKWGVAEVEYIVQPDGSVTDVKILKNVTGAESLGNELARVVNSLPRFKQTDNAKAESIKLSTLFFIEGVSQKDKSVKTDATVTTYAK